MVLVPGEPCVGTKKRKRNQGAEDEPLQLCAAVETHKWYQGPLCKNCYLRKKTAESSGKPAKMGKIEDAPAESGGDIPLDVCLKVSAARCACSRLAPAPNSPAFALHARAFCGHAQTIGHLADAGRPEQPSAGVGRRRGRGMHRVRPSTAGSSSSPTPTVFAASTVSGSCCMIWSSKG